MTEPLHQTLAQGKWHTMTLANQLANVGSEFSRAYRARQSQNNARFDHAFSRMMELLCLTTSDPRWTGLRKQELCRLKEVICEGFFGDAANLAAVASLERYFYYFGVEARAQSG